MATRQSTNFRFPPKFKTALSKVAKAQGISQAKLLEAVFWMYQEQVSKMTADERRKLDAEAREYLERITRGNIE